MSDDAFKELMKSPLEEPRRSATGSPRHPHQGKRSSNSKGGWIPALIAMVVGATVVIVGYLVAGVTNDDDAALPSTTTTTLAPAPGGSVFPHTYTPINSRLAVRAERILQRADTTYVSFSAVVAAGLEPDETAGIVGGQWQLTLRDGSSVASTEDFFDPLARGTFSVAFPAVDSEAIDGVRLVGEAVRSTNGFTSDYAFDPPLPFSTETATVFGLEDDLELHIDSFDLAVTGSRIAWHLEGDPAFGAAVDVFVETDDGSGRIPGDTIFESRASGFRRNFGTTIAPEPTRREGEIGLEFMAVGNPDSTYAARAFWTVAWVSYLPTDVAVSLEDVPIHTSAG